MSNTVCHCLVAGLNLDQQRISERFGAAGQLPAALRRLTGRADHERLPSVDLYSDLLRTHGIQSEAASGAAAIMASGDGLDAGRAVWLRADPVHLSIEQDRLVLQDAQFLNLSGAEAHALSETLNTHFAADGIEFFVAEPYRWYMRVSYSANTSTTPLDQVRGCDIHPHLPRGDAAMLWHRHYNEIQMLLHSHPVNQAREQRGALPVNSVWGWGEGELPAEAAAAYSALVGEDPILKGLAQLTKTPQHELPASAHSWLASKPSEGEHLILLDALKRPWAYRSGPQWYAALAELEAAWFAPLAAALSHGLIQSLKISALTAEQYHRYTIGKRMLWRFWRR